MNDMYSEDKWRHRSQRMRCATCLYFVPKAPFADGSPPAGVRPDRSCGKGCLCPKCELAFRERISNPHSYVNTLSIPPLETPEISKPKHQDQLGRCRRHAPTLNGWPAVFATDWCGDHKLDENKL